MTRPFKWLLLRQTFENLEQIKHNFFTKMHPMANCYRFRDLWMKQFNENLLLKTTTTKSNEIYMVTWGDIGSVSQCVSVWWLFLAVYGAVWWLFGHFWFLRAFGVTNCWIFKNNCYFFKKNCWFFTKNFYITTKNCHISTKNRRIFKFTTENRISVQCLRKKRPLSGVNTKMVISMGFKCKINQANDQAENVKFHLIRDKLRLYCHYLTDNCVNIQYVYVLNIYLLESNMFLPVLPVLNIPQLPLEAKKSLYLQNGNFCEKVQKIFYLLF